MEGALYVAMSGAKRSLTQQNVYGNNLANVNTAGFRADLYQAQSMYLGGTTLPAQVFSESIPSAQSFKAGAMMRTGRELDVAIRDKGFFAVVNNQGQIAYTRAGNFSPDANGVLRTANGLQVVGGGGPIAIPPYESLVVGEDGTISIVPQGEGPEAITILDQLLLVNPDTSQLRKGRDGLFYARGNAPVPADASVRIINETLEGSNVNSVDQMVNMISASRDFETQLKLMREVGDNQQALARLLQV